MPANTSPRQRRLADPAVRVFEITPDDTSDLFETTSAINVATPGIVRVTTEDGSISDVMIHPGDVFPIRARKVWHTGTTATGLRALV